MVKKFCSPGIKILGCLIIQEKSHVVALFGAPIIEKSKLTVISDQNESPISGDIFNFGEFVGNVFIDSTLFK
jgi:hypothetical protein